MNPQLVVVTGAANLRNVFPPDVLPGVLSAYMVGLKAAFIVAIAFAGSAVLISLAIPMRKLPTHTTDKDKVKDMPMMV